ncbi:hypothetical protein MMC14_003845 [Varicellaria rhodocarpa]|nr:hypothetical protein [Varicellaria rhodocarpa]
MQASFPSVLGIVHLRMDLMLFKRSADPRGHPPYLPLEHSRHKRRRKGTGAAPSNSNRVDINEVLAYKDLHKEHLLSVEELAALLDSKDLGDGTYYVTTEWFTARCLFHWRKMERAKSLGTTIERSYLDTSIDGHSISNWHLCLNVYLERIPRDQIAAAAVVGFGDPVI